MHNKMAIEEMKHLQAKAPSIRLIEPLDTIFMQALIIADKNSISPGILCFQETRMQASPIQGALKGPMLGFIFFHKKILLSPNENIQRG